MHTVQLDIADDKLDTFLTIIGNLRKDIVQNIRLKNDSLDIEPIEEESEDYREIQLVKEEGNASYTIDEVKKKLGL